MSTIECRLCRRTFEKGADAQPGQDDSTFVCDDCGKDPGGYPLDGRRNPKPQTPEPAWSFLDRILKRKT